MSERRAVAGEVLQALAVGFQNGLVDVGGLLLQPGKQGGPEVKANLGVVIDDAGDAAFGIENTRGAVGRVAFSGDALIPVVVGVGGILQLDGFQPGIFARGLIEMAVDADVAIHLGVCLVGTRKQDEGFRVHGKRRLTVRF